MKLYQISIKLILLFIIFFKSNKSSNDTEVNIKHIRELYSNIETLNENYDNINKYLKQLNNPDTDLKLCFKYFGSIIMTTVIGLILNHVRDQLNKKNKIKEYFNTKFNFIKNEQFNINNKNLSKKKIQLLKEKELSLLNEADKDFRELNKEVIKAYSNDFKNGFLLYGCPGSGKNYIIEAIAYFNDILLGSFSFNDFYSNQNIEKHFFISELLKFLKNNQNKKFIFFIDEIDLLISKRTNEYRLPQAEATELNFFLNLVESIIKVPNVVVICNTNEDPNFALDRAFRRPGRIEEYFKINPPDEKKIIYMLKKQLEKKSIEIENNSFFELLSTKLFKRKATSAEILLFLEKSKNKIINIIDKSYENLEKNLNQIIEENLKTQFK
jgi:ATP-dependent Zn protease